MAKTDQTTVKWNYVRKKRGLGATVPKDVPPKSAPHKRLRLPKGMSQHGISIPPEYEVVLQEMYPDVSIAIAIRKFIMDTMKVKMNNVFVILYTYSGYDGEIDRLWMDDNEKYLVFSSLAKAELYFAEHKLNKIEFEIKEVEIR